MYLYELSDEEGDTINAVHAAGRSITRGRSSRVVPRVKGSGYCLCPPGRNLFFAQGIPRATFGRRLGVKGGAEGGPGGGNLVKYMLLIYGDEQVLDDIDRERCYVESAELAQNLHSAGQYLAAAPLYPTSKAMSVRVRESRRLVTDGPFAETREQLGGYFLIEANDSDEAIDIAARIPMARLGTVEIRPVIEIPGLPKS